MKTRTKGSRTSGSVKIALKFLKPDVGAPAGLEHLAPAADSYEPSPLS